MENIILANSARDWFRSILLGLDQRYLPGPATPLRSLIRGQRVNVR